MDKKRYIKFFAGSENILDIGCGKGIFPPESISDKKYTGIDINSDNLRMLKGYTNKLEMDVDGEPLPFENNFFDAILANNIVEHIFHYKLFMSELNRVLKKNGKLIVRVPDYRSTNAWNDYTHLKPFTSNSIQRLLIDHGFDIVRIEASGGIKLIARITGYRIKNFIINCIPFFLPALSWVVYAQKIRSLEGR